MRVVPKRRKCLKSGIALMLCTVMFLSVRPMTAFAYSGAYYGSVSVGSTRSFNLASFWGFDVYSFTPSTTGSYTFYSYSCSGDPYFYLTNSSYYSTVYNSLTSYGCRNSTAAAYSLISNDDGAGDRNFKTTYTCYAGQTYYCFLTKYSTSTTSATFTISGPSYTSLTLERNGGTGGTSMLYGYDGQAWTSTRASSGVSYITPPTRAGYSFVGYYNTWASTGGELFIASNGYVYSNAKGASGSVVARWEQNTYTLTFNNQGAPNSSQVIGANNYYPSSITLPARTGYTFKGYYTGTSGSGTQYYNASGARNSAYTMTGNATLYAYWAPAVYNITYNGMDGAQPGANHPGTHTYGTKSDVSDPTKADYTFMGWSIAGNASRMKNLTLGATAYTKPITLTANWKKTTDVGITDGDGLTANTTANAQDLAKAFEHPVDKADADCGVTSDEMSDNASVELHLSVTKTNVDDEAVGALTDNSNGKVVSFFDATVTKKITSLDNNVTETVLKEIPVRIAVEIPLASDQQGKPSYAVYRYHTEKDKDTGDEYSEIQEISNDSSQTEYYVVDTDKITVYTRMFSTFAVVSGETSLTPRPDTATDKSGSGVDVQGKVSQSGLEAVYKLDVSWGAMAFAFTTAAEWDPYNHTWGDAAYAWSAESFNGDNNKLSIANHSNADVNAAISFAREASQLENTEVTFHEANAEEGSQVTSLYIPKVPSEGADAPEASAYVWLSGTPTILPGTAGETFKKVGVITLTFQGNEESGLTAKENE